jgi:outer membrane protein assembly factor BamD
MKLRVSFLFIFGLLFIFSSCSFQKILKNGTVDEKYETAEKLFNRKDYSRALQLFDQISGAMRATEKSQKIAYYYAYCYYYQKDYTLASYYFKRYSNNYPASPEAEECLFMCAYCNFLSSPEYSLDQTITMEALKDLQLFTNTYPGSKRVAECNDLMDQLRLKLELKDFKIAKLYYRMDDFAAAITMYNNILKDFPDTPHKEEILYLVVKSYHKYAKKSVYDKQKDRYNKTILAYNELASEYPNSKLLPEAAIMRDKAKAELEALNAGGDNKKMKRVKIQFDN